ncbi:signal transduction histidine kinase [Arcicella aurantiaca]|uniref:Signal transduction histidine kinase n=1 Tax=Arcicella aurantiaca TaxID=591202 RepID=A0A316DGS6_9BACT|nr:histidine kinase [Arcicella aurantiaca]PWK17344.1 signal transduction histidine kinase [Arcicella aurantiaca]
MKKLPSILSCLIILSSSAFTQNLQIRSVWHFKKGDISQDSIQKIIHRKQLFLKYNEVITLQFSPSNPNFTYFFRIPHTEKFNQWMEIGHEPIVQIPALEGDDYSLEICTNPNDKKTIAKISINIAKVIWEEGYFLPSIIIYVLFLIGIAVYFFSLYNLRQKLKLQDVRNRIAADLHDEVGSNLNSIAIFVELLRRKSPPELLPILDKITNNSTESVQLMQDTIWAIQAKNDDFQKFIDRMKGFSTEVLAAKGISLNFENQVDSSRNTLSMDARKNAYMIYKEAINNIVKHSKATKVEVKILMENHQIIIEISDNGVGFDPNQATEGNGLRNFEERAENNEMRLNINSVKGIGTKVLLEIPLI